MCHPHSAITFTFGSPLFWALLCLGFITSGCEKESAPPPSPPPSSATQALSSAGPPPPFQVLTPKNTGPFGPTLTSLREAGATPAHPLPPQLLNPKACAPCHDGIIEEWAPSAHALSSFTNPMYKVAFDAFIEAKGQDAAPFCGGCHDPALLLTGGLKGEILPEDPRAHAGIGCALCHGALDATPEGNGSYTLASTAIPIPRPGDALSLTAHRARAGMAKELGDVLCQSCHRGILGPHTDHPATLIGLDENGPWRRSPYGGSAVARVDPRPPEGKGCIGCHMDEGKGHHMPGGHSTLAAMAQSEAQAEAIEAQLRGAASIYIVPIALGPGGAKALGEVKEGDPIAFDVVIVNESVGHHFPGGARDLRDTWVEVEIRDGSGVLRAQAGSAYRRGGEDASAHRLGALVAGEGGEGESTHGVGNFRAGVFDHTIPPRDAAAIRFGHDSAPDLGEGPHTITARLLHRRLTPSFYESSCAEAKTEGGQAFLDGAQALGGLTVLPCPDQPILTLNEVSLAWGAERKASEPTPRWLVYYHHAQALSHQVQERLGEAMVSLSLASNALEARPEASPLERASLLALEGKIKGMMGQTPASLASFEAAQALTPDHGALPNLKAQSLARVWRWPEAQAAYEDALRWAPRHDGLWRGLAQAAGSAGDRPRGLEAAQGGLALEPRDPTLLRSQMLALEHLYPGSSEAKEARATYLSFRPDDLGPEVRGRCSDGSAECLRERLPIHQHPLLPPPK